MRLIIAGTRTFNPPDDILDFAVKLTEEMFGEKVATVLSGHSGGVDLAGERWAERNKVTLQKYPPDWKGLGKKAGPLRNKAMVENADTLLLIWNGVSP